MKLRRQTTIPFSPDRFRRVNRRNNAQPAATTGAFENIDRKNSVQKLSPRVIARPGPSTFPD